MVNVGKGRLFRRNDGKYLIYLPKDLCEDSVFPFKEKLKQSKRNPDVVGISVKVSFTQGGTALLVEPAP